MVVRQRSSRQVHALQRYLPAAEDGRSDGASELSDHPPLALFVEADEQWYFNRKSEAEAKDLTTGEDFNYGSNSAGISLRTARISAGVNATY